MFPTFTLKNHQNHLLYTIEEFKALGFPYIYRGEYLTYLLLQVLPTLIATYVQWRFNVCTLLITNPE